MTAHSASRHCRSTALLTAIAVAVGASACSTRSDEAVSIETIALSPATVDSVGPPASATPPITVDIDRDFGELDPEMADTFREVFGPPASSTDGGATDAPPVTDPPPVTNPPPATTPPSTAPPTTAPPTTAVTDEVDVGLPVAAFAPSAEVFIDRLNVASEVLADTPDLNFDQVVFDFATFNSEPGVEDGTTIAVGRDTTNGVFIGIVTDAVGGVTGVTIGGPSGGASALSASVALWLMGDGDISALAEAYLAAVDVESDPVLLPAVDGGTWSILDLESTVAVGKIQNSDHEFVSLTSFQIVIHTVALLPPL